MPDQFRRLRSALKQLAEGLNALHDAGRLHRDVKPSNILVTHTGRVVLIDFGSASGFGGSDLFEAVPCGTLAYMSPEQSAREPLSPASDWYSFGVLLYELLTGCFPFSGTAKEMLLAKRAAVPPLANVAAEAPRDLVDLCARLLHWQPSQRPGGPEVLAICRGPLSRRRRATWTVNGSSSLIYRHAKWSGGRRQVDAGRNRDDQYPRVTNALKR